MGTSSRLQGSAALVTGGSGGIGKAIARMLLEEGCDVTIVGRNQERLDAARTELTSGGGTVLTVSADLTSEAGIDSAVAAHADRFGRLDVLVNNAGVAVASKAGLQPRSVMAEIVAIDLAAVLLLYQAGLDLLLTASAERGRANVVNVASITGRFPQPWLAVYSSTKAAVLSYTHAMNQAYARKGLLSTAICPGFADTDMSAEAEVPRHEMIPVVDIAEIVRTVLRLSDTSYVPEVLLARPKSDDPSGL